MNRLKEKKSMNEKINSSTVAKKNEGKIINISLNVAWVCLIRLTKVVIYFYFQDYFSCLPVFPILVLPYVHKECNNLLRSEIIFGLFFYDS